MSDAKKGSNGVRGPNPIPPVAIVKNVVKGSNLGPSTGGGKK